MDGAGRTDSKRRRPVIDVRLAARGWRRALGRPVTLCRRAAEAALAAAHACGPLELSILLADDAALRRLNRDYRGKDTPTNVLAFPAAAGAIAPRPLGDVVLALETLEREAAAERKAPADHAAHLIVHGVLHLLGYDHARGAQARRMRAREIAALARLDVPDPYGRPARARRSPANRHERTSL